MSTLGQAKYMIDYSDKVNKRHIVDKRNIPLLKLRFGPMKGSIVNHPVMVMQYALGHHNLSVAGRTESRRRFLDCVDWLETAVKTEPHGRFDGWFYTFPLRTPPVNAPWLSGMAQGQGLSILLRAFQLTRAERTESLLHSVARSFLFTVEEGGVSSRLPENGLFIEEIACGTPLRILNGCLYALLGIIEYVAEYPDSELAPVVESCTMGVAQLLPSFDMGYWSRRSLGIRWNIATRHYHNLHIRQLRYLGRRLDNSTFLTYADRWEEYRSVRRNQVRQGISRCVHMYATAGAVRLKLNRLAFRVYPHDPAAPTD